MQRIRNSAMILIWSFRVKENWVQRLTQQHHLWKWPWRRDLSWGQSSGTRNHLHSGSYSATDILQDPNKAIFTLCPYLPSAKWNKQYYQLCAVLLEYAYIYICVCVSIWWVTLTTSTWVSKRNAKQQNLNYHAKEITHFCSSFCREENGTLARDFPD